MGSARQTYFVSSLNREPVFFAALIILLAAFFAFTTVLVGRYHDQQAALARDWFQRGEKALQSSRYTEAVEDFRNALVYDHDDPQYRLRLAEALIAVNQSDQARSHLLNLLEDEPGDGEVNLELARMAAKDGNLRDAQRYYQTAIYGVWPDDPITHRMTARFELAEFLLAQKQPAKAEAELVAIASAIPEKRPDLELRLASLFLKAGDNRAALEHFKAAAAQQPDSGPALAGAGEAAFREQDFANAQDFLQHAVQLNPGDTHSAELLKTSALVQRMNPYGRGLNATERVTRAVAVFQFVLSRLEQCETTTSPASDAVTSALARGRVLQAQVRPQALRSNPDLLDVAMQWAFSAEQVAGDRCGAASDEDQAILLISNLRQKEK